MVLQKTVTLFDIASINQTHTGRKALQLVIASYSSGMNIPMSMIRTK
jgi:hypothetical protein